MTRRAAVRRVGAVILAANLLLAVGKAVVFGWSGSLAVGSEAVNSVADSAYSLIVLAGLYLTTQPPDFEHPHGHERIEPLVSLFVALAIFGAGAVVLWRAGSSLVVGAPAPRIGPAAVAVLVGSGVVKYALYRYCVSVGEARRSPALIATGFDNRNDILTAGAALVGVLGAAAGHPWLDPAAAAVVSVGIFYTGWVVVRDNVDYLIGRAPPDDLRVEILETALAHPDVRGAHDVIAHYVGPEVDVSLHIEVEGDLTLNRAHDIETEVAAAIRELPAVDDVFVHVDPRELGEWKEDRAVDELLERSMTEREHGGTDENSRGAEADGGE